IETPHGSYRGWYSPIDYSQEFVGRSKKLLGETSLEQEGYYRATVPAGYTKKVTAYIAPLDLHLEGIGGHIRSMLHDIAFREAIIQASKIAYDERIQNHISAHYGVQYKNMMKEYLPDIANSTNSKFGGEMQRLGVYWSEFFRQNVIGTLIGFNP